MFIWPFSYVIYLNQQPIKMTDWPADARAFSRPTSKAREKRPGDEVELIFTCVYTHVNFTRVNEIEATYEAFLLDVN